MYRERLLYLKAVLPVPPSKAALALPLPWSAAKGSVTEGTGWLKGCIGRWYIGKRYIGKRYTGKRYIGKRYIGNWILVTVVLDEGVR